jgi:hypothetical protein
MAPEPQPATDLSLVSGDWALDPSKTTVEFHTKAMWVMKVSGTAKATGGGAHIDADGTITGSLVIDAASIDTGNISGTPTSRAPTSSRSSSTRRSPLPPKAGHSRLTTCWSFRAT